MADHTFCRMSLAQVMPEVKKVTTVQERKDAWAYIFESCDGHGEFHGPNKFYWHGSACCKWISRYYGWSAWLEKHHPEVVQYDPDE